jgi:hypothetical protein
MNQDKFCQIQQQQQHSILKSSSMDSETFLSHGKPTYVSMVKKLTDIKQVTRKKSIELLEKPLVVGDLTTKKEVKNDRNATAATTPPSITTTSTNSVQQLEATVAVQQKHVPPQVAQQYNAPPHAIYYQDPNSQIPIQFLTSQPGVHPYGQVVSSQYIYSQVLPPQQPQPNWSQQPPQQQQQTYRYQSEQQQQPIVTNNSLSSVEQHSTSNTQQQPATQMYTVHSQQYTTSASKPVSNNTQQQQMIPIGPYMSMAANATVQQLAGAVQQQQQHQSQMLPQQQPQSVPLAVPQQPAAYVKRDRTPLRVVDPTTKKEIKIDPNATSITTTSTNSSNIIVDKSSQKFFSV